MVTHTVWLRMSSLTYCQKLRMMSFIWNSAEHHVTLYLNESQLMIVVRHITKVMNVEM